MKRKLFLHIFIPLFIGGALYLLLCPEAFISRWFYALAGMDPPAIAGGALLRAVRNHLADMLWAWALTCSAWLVLGRCRAAAAAAICAGFLVELAQGALGIGTFDWLDAALEALTAAAAALYLAERRQTQ